MTRTAELTHLDPDLPLAERVDSLVAQMSLREKVAQMVHRAAEIRRLGVPAYDWWNECLHGVARAGKATVFPQAIGLAATFDVPLIHRMATATSDEARAKHHEALRLGSRAQYFGLTYWTPNINIFRDPRWGRGQETYGEDPYLTARLGVAFVKGLQGDDPNYLKLVATPKHYAVHSGPEPLRHTFDAVVSGRDLRETYLPAFKACVQEAGAWSVMGAYNRTNGEPCCGSPTLLQKILRDEWGFPGYVVSDCWAIKDFHEGHHATNTPAESAVLAVKSGCDLNCGELFNELVNAVKDGLIAEADLDISVKRLMTARFKLGMFDPEERVPYAAIPPEVVHCPEHQALARQTARESIVLLKNDGNLLPLARNAKSITVIGPTAFNLDVLCGNYYGYSPQMTTILEGIINAASPGTQVHYAEGCSVAGKAAINENYFSWMLPDTDLIIAVMGFTPALEGEEADAMDEIASEGGGDRLRIGLPGRQLELLQRLHATGKPVVLVLTGGSPIELEWAAEHIPAIVMAWYPGEEGGNAVADVLFGDYNPAGRLPITFVKSLEQLPDFTDYAMAGRTYRFMHDEPRYRFGYGMSYTTFTYCNLWLSRDMINAEDQVTVTAEVRNTGSRAGDEVAQLYVSDIEATVPVPLMHLEGVTRIHLQPGETQTVAFTLTSAQLAAYADDGTPFVEAGQFRIAVGGGQPDDPASEAVTAVLTVG
ncbi:MAG: glycoside hydrolase family 3 C-terminal domain-containing protein [Armatimonadota bacterium]